MFPPLDTDTFSELLEALREDSPPWDEGYGHVCNQPSQCVVQLPRDLFFVIAEVVFNPI